MCNFDGHIRNLGSVPEDLLRAIDARLAAFPDIWEFGNATKPNKFACFDGTTSHVVFQYPISLKDHKQSRFLPLWQTWQDVIQPIVDQVVPTYGYEHGRTSRIMVARLHAGKSIGTHTDAARAAKVPHKIHVPLMTSPEVQFLAEDVGYHLERGFAYEVNNRIPHGGVNNSNVDRIHLIFDYFDEAPSLLKVA